MNNLKLITNHKDYWLLISDPTIEIKSGYFYHPKGVVFPVTDTYKKGLILSGLMSCIISHLPKHKDAPLLEGVLLMIPQAFKNKNTGSILLSSKNPEHIEKFLNSPKVYEPVFELPKKEEDEKIKLAKLQADYSVEHSSLEAGVHFGDGYKANTKRWSDEDMRSAIRWGSLMNPTDTKAGEKLIDEYLQSLSPVKTPVGFEPEYETWHIGGGYGLAHSQPLQTHYKFKTIKSTYNGKEVEVLQGRWIYES